MTNSKTTYGLVALVAVLPISTVAIAFSQSAVAAPANKTTYGASSIGAIAVGDDWTPIASSTIKTSNPSDLRISHNQECTIHTGLNLDQDNEQATSSIREDVRVKIIEEDDSSYIVPAVPGTDDDGVVTLCGRAYSIDTNVLSTVYELCSFIESIDIDGDGNTEEVCTADEIYFNSFIRTKQAHSWDWIAMDLGSGTHTVVVEAKLVNEFPQIGDGNGKAKKSIDGEEGNVDTLLEIGKRNLIVVEDKLATGA